MVIFFERDGVFRHASRRYRSSACRVVMKRFGRQRENEEEQKKNKKGKRKGPSFTVENAKSLDGSEDLGEQTYGDKKFATFMWKGKFYAYYNSDGNAGCIAIDGSNIQPDNEAIQKVLSSIKIK